MVVRLIFKNINMVVLGSINVTISEPRLVLLIARLKQSFKVRSFVPTNRDCDLILECIKKK